MPAAGGRRPTQTGHSTASRAALHRSENAVLLEQVSATPSSRYDSISDASLQNSMRKPLCNVEPTDF